MQATDEGTRPSWLEQIEADVKSGEWNEVPGKGTNPNIADALRKAGAPADDKIAHCGACLAMLFERVGFDREQLPMKPAWARNWANWGTPLETPVPGAVVGYERNAKGGDSHVAIFLATRGGNDIHIGYNQSNKCKVSETPSSKRIYCRWPESIPQPTTAEPAKPAPILQEGSEGDDVIALQMALNGLGIEPPLKEDGHFGPLTEKAVMRFQELHGLEPDGIVGPKTRAAMMDPVVEVSEPEPAAESTPEVPEIIEEAPAVKPPEVVLPQLPDDKLEIALQITGGFEGSGYGQVTGDFDRHGISLGMLQWNLGTGSLQEKILQPFLAHGSIDDLCLFPMGGMDKLARMAGGADGPACEYARMFMLDGTKVKPEWKAAWVKFLMKPEVIALQQRACSSLAHKAEVFMKKYGLHSLRSFCFFFDVAVQNGSMKDVPLQNPNRQEAARVIASIHDKGDGPKNKQLWPPLLAKAPDEAIMLLLTGYKRAQLANKLWAHDVFMRKATVALGVGFVHGKQIDVRERFDAHS